MDFANFIASLDADQPPTELSFALQALWHDRRRDWSAAHDAAQAQNDQQAAWVHAYLHRKEGDLANARYWYNRASKAPASGSLEEEWEAIARALTD